MPQGYPRFNVTARIRRRLSKKGLLSVDASMIDLISRFDLLREAIGEAAANGRALKLDPAQFKPPVERPSKIWAAASMSQRVAKE